MHRCTRHMLTWSSFTKVLAFSKSETISWDVRAHIPITWDRLGGGVAGFPLDAEAVFGGCVGGGGRAFTCMAVKVEANSAAASRFTVAHSR